MKATVVSEKFLSEGEDLFERVRGGEVFIVKNFFCKDLMTAIEERLSVVLEEPETWIPFFDDCVDYHRINNEYEHSFVKGKTHSFMLHFYKNMNKKLLEKTMKLWRIKLGWLNCNDESEISLRMAALPSDGYVPRLVSHLYPAGGGYLSRHKDPRSDFNPLQTLIVGSEFGEDFNEGGLYIYNASGEGFFVDEHCSVGDLFVFDQSFDHEVRPVDPCRQLDWESISGRLQHVFLFARSDYLKGVVPDVQS